MAVAYEPIKAIKLLGGAGFPAMSRHSQGATLTTPLGVPLTLASGHLVESAFSSADIVYGVSSEPGGNLAVAGTAQNLSEGTPPNMPLAVITPVGAWVRDGLIGYYAADGKTVFSIMLKDGQVFTAAMMAGGTLYGITKDGTSGFWYLDNTDTSGNNAVARVVGVDPSSPNTVALGARVFFQFDSTKRYFN
jgi:hypothetical protein